MVLESPFHSEPGGILTRYLSGARSFHAAAHALAGIIRPHRETSRQRLPIKELALSEWVHQQSPYVSPAALTDAIPRRSPIDHFKADTLWREACRPPGLPGGGAPQLAAWTDAARSWQKCVC